jgi:hypothetical protein
MKKIFALSAMCIITMLFTNSAMSQVVASGTTGACTWELTGTSGNYTLTISGAGAMGDYGYGGSPWYSYRNDITTLDLQQGVTAIGDYAFYFCSVLTSVTSPNSVTSIGEDAFSYCSGLTSVTIPNSVTSIGSLAFVSCSALTSIDVDASNPDYSSVNGVLFNKLQDTLIQYPSGKIGDYTIPNSVTSIGNDAFYTCSVLTSVTIPNSVTSIGGGAFCECSGLISVTIPNSVTSIGSLAFGYCSVLTSIDVDASNPDYSSVNGVLFNKLQDELMQYPSGKIGDYTIPNSVTTIGAGAFWSYSGFTSITIPNSVMTIGAGAFFSCSGLTSVTIGNSVTTIEMNAFLFCDGLTELHVKAQTPPALGDNAFGDVSATIPVYVCGTVSAYQSASGWNYFTNIIEDCSGIPIVETGHTPSLPQIYPNPANNELRIKNYALQEGDRVELYNMLGHHPQSAIVNASLSTLYVSHLASGVYMLRIVSDNKVICAEKVVIAR